MINDLTTKYCVYFTLPYQLLFTANLAPQYNALIVLEEFFSEMSEGPDGNLDLRITLWEG